MTNRRDNPLWSLRLHAPAETAAKQFEQALALVWGLDTIQDSQGGFISRAPRLSFITHVLRNIPCRLTWVICDEEQNDQEGFTSIVNCRTSLPRVLLIEIYVLAGILGLFLASLSVHIINLLADLKDYYIQLYSAIALLSVLAVMTGVLGYLMLQRMLRCLVPPEGVLHKLIEATKKKWTKDTAIFSTEIVECCIYSQASTRPLMNGLIVFFIVVAPIFAFNLSITPFNNSVEYLVSLFSFWFFLGLLLVWGGSISGFLLKTTERDHVWSYQLSVLILPVLFAVLFLTTYMIIDQMLFLVMPSAYLYIKQSLFLCAPSHLGMDSHDIQRISDTGTILAIQIFFGIGVTSYLIWILLRILAFLSSQSKYFEGSYRMRLRYRYSDLLNCSAEGALSATKMTRFHLMTAIAVCAIFSVIVWSIILMLANEAIAMLLSWASWPLSGPISLLFGSDQNNQMCLFMYCGVIQDAPNRGNQICALIIALSALFPVILVVVGNLHFFLGKRSERLAMLKVKGVIKDTAADITRWYGIAPVNTLLEPRASMPLIYSEIRGIRGKPYIIIHEAFARVLEKYPNHTKAILAHEISHLVHHCRLLRRWRILSRLMLTGVSTLNFLRDSIAFEDNADQEAMEYLKHEGLPEVLLDEALSLHEECNAQRHVNCQENRKTLFAATTGPRNLSKDGNKEQIQKWFLRILHHIWSSYNLYFFDEDIFYLHPASRMRGTALTKMSYDDTGSNVGKANH